MKLFRLFSLLLCLAMLLSLFGCSDAATQDGNEDTPADPPASNNNETKDPTLAELENYIARAKNYYNLACVKITDTLLVEEGGTALPEESSSFFAEGENKITFANEALTDVTYICANGTVYVPSTKKSYRLPSIAAIKDSYVAPKFQVTLFDTFQYEQIKITKNEDGTVTVTGSSPASQAKEDIAILFGPMIPMENAKFHYSAMTSTLVFDAQGRLLSQSATVSATAQTVPFTLTKTQSYDYGVQYSVSAPADAASYTAVNSISDLYR